MRFNYSSIFTLIFIFICSQISAQKVDFNVTKYDGIKKLKTINVSDIEDQYLPHLQNLEAPNVSGNVYKEFLAKRKIEIGKKYPPNYTPIATKRSFVNPPEVIKAFPVINIQQGIPCDNHLAMNGEDIVSCGNFYMAVHNPNGGLTQKFTLDQFAQAAGITPQPFDPRVAYDVESDRYVFTFLAGNSSSNTHIVVAYSATNDPTGDWNIYNLPGNPNSSNEWTDYPMISLTNDHLYLTINLLRDGLSWQEGFVETVIWQMNKHTGYAGEDLEIAKIDGISFDGTNVRNLCPAESATETMYDDVYLVSNRNFAFEADTFFLLKIDPNAMNPDDFIKLDLLHSDVPYGAPPNATQKVGFLQTNDARVLEAFRLGNEIQFVGNTRNPDNNLAGIYHGTISDITNPQTIDLNHIIGPDYEIGYPGITYTGETESDRDAIIAFNRTSKTINPGVSALYSIPEEGYSQIVLIGQGNNYVDMLGGDLERWGDYLGTQRDYNDPSTVWIAGFIGIGATANAPLVGRVQKPEVPTSTEEIQVIDRVTNVFPNPISDRTSIEINVPLGTKTLQINLVSVTGELIDVIYTSTNVQGGKNAFSFDASSLPTGSYLVKVLLDEKEVKSEKVIKI